ncbi:MAG: ATP-binding protein [Pseudonocardiaceae bacterium]
MSIVLDVIKPRRLEPVVRGLMMDEPVIVLTGPRTVGKSTLLRCLAHDHGVDVIDLDDTTTRRLVAQDLALFVAGHPPVMIDEFQHIPEILDAIKAELNRDTRPGHFLLTGPTRYSTLPRTAQSLTGRVHVVTVWPLSQGEITGTVETFLTTLLADDSPTVPTALSRTSREQYVERVLAGGLPAVLRRRPGRPRARWYEDYLNLVVERDVLDIRNIHQGAVLPEFLRTIAAQTGQILNIAQAARGSGIKAALGEDYLRLLEAVFLVHRIPAWGITLGARVNKLPKIHLVDSGLGGWLLGLTERALSRRLPAAMTEFGHLLETFAVNELLKQASWIDESLRCGHYRTSDGHEVDLVVEHHDGRCFAIEIKAGASYRPEDLRGLTRLRDKLGDAFTCGVLLYLGERGALVDDRLYVLPLDRLWS